jgi:hypothetical protein
MVSKAVATVPGAKHDDGGVKPNFVTLTVWPFCVIAVVKSRAKVPSELSRPAVQFPLSVFSGVELNPQASNANVMEKMIVVPKRFIEILRESGQIIGDRFRVYTPIFGILFHTTKAATPGRRFSLIDRGTNLVPRVASRSTEIPSGETSRDVNFGAVLHAVIN